MADVIGMGQLRRAPKRQQVEPFVAKLLAKGNARRVAAVAGADRAANLARAGLNHADRRLRESQEELDRRRAEYLDRCGESPGISNPVWIHWLGLVFFAVFLAGEYAIANAALDYVGMAGPTGEGTFADSFLNDKSLAAAAMAVGTFLVSKVTGTWMRQRQAGRAGGVPVSTIVLGNLAFLAVAAAFSYLREISIAAEGVAELSNLWPAFFALQTFLYAAGTVLAAAAADPDPEAARLSKEVARLTGVRDGIWAKRSGISSRVSGILSKGRIEAAVDHYRTLMAIAAYRDQNLGNRPKGEDAPEFMSEQLPDDSLVPLSIDAPPDPPAGDVCAAVGQIGGYRPRAEDGRIAAPFDFRAGGGLFSGLGAASGGALAAAGETMNPGVAAVRPPAKERAMSG